MNVRLATFADKNSWDSYVMSNPDSTHCHLFGWKGVIERAYGHKGYYFLAEKDFQITGVLPLIHLKSWLFGNHFVSMPFLNSGGVLADSEESAQELVKEAVKIASNLKVSSIELRHLNLVPSLTSNKPFSAHSLSLTGNNNFSSLVTEEKSLVTHEKTHKVRMILQLPNLKEELWNSLKSKLRSQISRPIKEGMEAILGCGELVDPFYKVFSINMRDLGSPVHSKKLFREICSEFIDKIKIGIVYYKEEPAAAGLIFSHRDTVEIPWASSLKELNKLSPNMLLYWSFLEFSCEKCFKFFDFGRSTPEEGTYRFKEQWGGSPSPLFWTTISLNKQTAKSETPDKSNYDTLIRYWKKLPVQISVALGPVIRKNISL